jgi:hypothetical protein
MHTNIAVSGSVHISSAQLPIAFFIVFSSFLVEKTTLDIGMPMSPESVRPLVPATPL